MDGARVLVVDDERFFRESIRDALAGAGIDTVLVGSGEEALEQASDESIGVVVLDLVLPDLHGLEVFRHLRECRPDLRVVILSGHTDQDSVLEALRLGAFDYLAKPLHEEELRLAVRRALDTFGIASGWSRLRERLGRLESTLAALWERARERSGPLPVEAIQELAVRAASEVLGAARTSLLLLDEKGESLTLAAARGSKLETEPVEPVRLGEGVAGLAAARGEPILVADVAQDARFGGGAEPGRYRTGSFAVAPLSAGARVLGVLCATEREQGGPFGEDDLALLRILSGQLALMLAEPPPGAAPAAPEPAETAGDAHGRATELARAICEAVTVEVEPGRVLDAVLRPVARLLDAAPVSLFLADEERRELRLEASCDGGRAAERPRLPAQLGLTGGAFAGGALVAAPAPAEDPRFDARVDTPADGVARPLLCGPLRFRGRALGVFRVFLSRGEDADPELGEVLGAALSAAVRNVLLYRSLVATIDEVAEARRAAGSGRGAG